MTKTGDQLLSAAMMLGGEKQGRCIWYAIHYAESARKKVKR